MSRQVFSFDPRETASALLTQLVREGKAVSRKDYNVEIVFIPLKGSYEVQIILGDKK